MSSKESAQFSALRLPTGLAPCPYPPEWKDKAWFQVHGEQARTALAPLALARRFPGKRWQVTFLFRFVSQRETLVHSNFRVGLLPGAAAKALRGSPRIGNTSLRSWICAFARALVGWL